MSRYLPFRLKRVSLLVDKKAVALLGILLILIAGVAVLSLGTGDMAIPPVDVVKALFGAGEGMQELVVRSFRLPRILLAMMAGMALAVSGAVLQGIIRNPLASPDLMGITGGASFAVVSFYTAFSDRANALTVSVQWLPLAAFIGAFLVGVVVYALAWRGGVTPLRLVLIGIGLTHAMQALTTIMILFGPIYLATQVHIWTTGSVNGSNWNHVTTLLPWVLLMLAFIWIGARKLNIQELGEEIARGAGSRVQRDRLLLLAFSTALAGGAVAFAGGIGFVGLMAPHIGRRLVGPSYGALIPVSALIGGLLVMGADWIGRTAFSPLEVPAGVFTSAIGAPYFIYLLIRSRN
ncbi:iron complex transport system permease protein [Planifilum fimeticola]|jgi:iron complex transport system permease protein|uniref:Iron complex transport system permease protein n=1 Tax=Planifilum fimeticola TaxID=201975 RepID=A0A2T0LAE6_9BACL|nr:iron ABC transporter permease [Planifilum fimeticola]PRX38757.1 iron complex transport system permease protein [Planifilum fimeticola]